MAQQQPRGQGQQVGQGRQTGGGQQMGHQGGQMGGQQQYDEYQQLIPQAGIEFDEDLTSELRVAVHDLEEVSRKTKWCIDNMIDEGPQMASCVRACRDVGSIADLLVDFVASDSIYAIEGSLLFVTVAEDAIQEIRSHQHPHCQETADAVGRAIDSAWGILESFGDPGMSQQLLEQLQQLKQEAVQTQQLPHSMERHQGGMQGGQPGTQRGGTQQSGTQQPTGQGGGFQQQPPQQGPPTQQSGGTQQRY